MRWSDLAVLLIFGLPLAAQPIGGGIFGSLASAVSGKVNGAGNLTIAGALSGAYRGWARGAL